MQKQQNCSSGCVGVGTTKRLIRTSTSTKAKNRVMMTETVVTVQHQPTNGAARGPPGDSLAWIQFNVDYFKTIPGILKLVQLVSRDQWKLTTYTWLAYLAVVPNLAVELLIRYLWLPVIKWLKVVSREPVSICSDWNVCTLIIITTWLGVRFYDENRLTNCITN